MTYLKIFVDFAKDTEALNDSEIGRLFRAMLFYAETGTEPELRGNERFVWGTARKNIDNQKSRYDAQCVAGKAAAEARWNANRINRIQSDANGCEICQEKEKDKDKDKDKEKEKKDKRKEVYFPDSFSPKMAEAVERWLAYKRERREAYKPQGQQALLSQIENRLKTWSEADVIALIDECMANGWKGIIWDRLERKPQKLQAEPTYDLDSWELLMQKQQEAMMG